MTKNETVICPRCGEPGIKSLETRRCNKKNCKCHTQNILHGPYWYVWHNKNNQRVHHYIGKNWPEEPSEKFPYAEGGDKMPVSEKKVQKYKKSLIEKGVPEEKAENRAEKYRKAMNKLLGA